MLHDPTPSKQVVATVSATVGMAPAGLGWQGYVTSRVTKPFPAEVEAYRSGVAFSLQGPIDPNVKIENLNLD